jgi:hypothetical protein
MNAKWYDLGSSPVNEPEIPLETKSLYKATILCEQMLGVKLIRMSFNWALMGIGNKRLLVSAVDEN